MKKPLRLLAMALCLMLVMPMALAMPGDFSIVRDQDDYENRYSSLVADEGMLYLMQKDSIYVLKAGESEPQLLLSGLVVRGDDYFTDVEKDPHYIDTLLGEDGMLYGLNSNNGMLFSIDAQNCAPVYGDVVQLEWDVMIINADDDYSYTSQMSNMQIIDGKLYVTSQNWENGDGSYMTHIFDIKTGKRTDLKTKHIAHLTPYKDGKLLVVIENQQEMWDSESQTYKPSILATFDPATETVTEVAKLSLGDYYNRMGYVYDAASDTLYFTLPNRVYRMVALGTPELCAYHLASNIYSYSSTRCSALLDGKYVLLTYEGLFVRGTDPKQLPSQTLTIGRSYMDDADRIAMAAMGDIPVIYTNVDSDNAQEMAQRIVGGEDGIDIFYVSPSYMDISRLMEKGYCYDLSKVPALTDYAGSLFPVVQDSVKLNGKLYAIPTEIWSYGFSYYPNALKEIGMEPPANFIELCEFITKWNDEYMDEYSDYQPFEWSDYRRSLISMAMEWYADYMQATGQPLTLDTPLLRSLLSAIDEVHCDELDIPTDWENDPEGSEAAMEEIWNKKTLFMEYGNFGIQRYSDPEDRWYTVSVPLPLTADVEPTMALREYVYFVNPKSKNIDAAIQYLQAYCAAVSEEMRASMSFEAKDAILSPYYESGLVSIQKYVDGLKRQIEKTTDPVELTSLKESLASEEEYLIRYEKNNRYLATAESIKGYHDLIQYAFVAQPSMLYSRTSDEFSQLYQRYYSGQMTTEQFIKEGDAKLRMMQLENQ